MNIIAIIPARMGSSRFPGKPLAKIHGIPMIGHCYFRTRMCEELSETYVATCDQEIFDYIEGDDTTWEREPMEALAKGNQLNAFKHDSYWQSMDSLRDKNVLEEIWDSGNPPWKKW